MKKQSLEELAKLISDILEKRYPNSKCSLIFKNNFELIIAARLSAQCTDKCVNRITPKLFSVFPNAILMASAKIEEIENLIKPCGIYKTKAREIKEISKILKNEYDSKIPFGIENLIKLPGIGRKTANLVMSEVFGEPAVIVDTHVLRVTRRLGFHNTNNADKTENILISILPKNIRTKFCHRILEHGRNVCISRKPKCEMCCLNDYCLAYKIAIF
ncbi:MAG: endonuclease III [Oscillospiraceae bacterium]|jgi:endonuclease-3|nr:endonuclease III [Oscillospiraceae bacterium]